MTVSAEELHAALAAANRSRALLYIAILRALEQRLPRDAAVAILREAIRDWGRHLGDGLVGHAPDGFAGLQRDFATAPDEGRMFSPRVESCDSHGLDVQFMTCPLKEAWQESGLSGDEVALLCSIASEADVGTLDRAGFAVAIETWRPGLEGCCRLRIRPMEKA
jgi:hypothetical protein